jgi:hypothetical protein
MYSVPSLIFMQMNDDLSNIQKTQVTANFCRVGNAFSVIKPRRLPWGIAHFMFIKNDESLMCTFMCALDVG